MPLITFAHETWFTPGAFPLDWSFAGQAATLALLAAALLATAGVRLLARYAPGVDVPALGRLAPWMPFAVRLHLAVSLLGLLSMGVYLAPSMDLQPDLAGIALGAVMAVVAIGMATGWHARAAALLLIAAGPLGMLEFGVTPVLARVDMLGLAGFVALTGAGRWSADFETGRAGELSVAAAARAIWSLRVGAGLALIVVAFLEKLANPAMALAFLTEHPNFNVAQDLGIAMSNVDFVRAAGAVEVLFGLLVISGALSQAAVLIAGVPFNATLWFFGTDELLGHLPIYAAMLVLLVFASDAALRPAVSALWPWGRPAQRSSSRRQSRPSVSTLPV